MDNFPEIAFIVSLVSPPRAVEEAVEGDERGHVEEGYFMGDSETLTFPYILPLSVEQAGCY